MRAAALIVAAGAGVRMGQSGPKAFLMLEGVSLLERCVRTFDAHPGVDRIVLMVPSGLEPKAREVVSAYRKLRSVAAGGDRRQDTVQLGLDRLAGHSPSAPGLDTLVLIHDAARPLVEPGLITAVIEAAARSGAAVPGIPASDTVKQVGSGAETSPRFLAGTLDRKELVLAQTPQGFRLSLLREAYARADADRLEATDDARLVELMGHRVELVPGSKFNIKVTEPEDLLIAAALLKGR